MRMGSARRNIDVRARVGTVEQQGVVARAAIEGEAHEPRDAITGDKDVIAVAAMEDDVLGTADIEREVRRRGFVEVHPCAVGGDAEGFRSGAAVEYDGVDALAAVD